MNIFDYIKQSNNFYLNMIANSTQPDYQPLTTAWQDLTIAEPYGLKALNSTYKKLLAYCRSDFKKMVELEVCLNWKMWQFSESPIPNADKVVCAYKGLYIAHQQETLKQMQKGTKAEQEKKAEYHFQMTD